MRGINRSAAGLKAQQITGTDEGGGGSRNGISGRMDKEKNQSGGRSAVGVGSTARRMGAKEQRR